jgi:Arrestin (or S-antigen), N-terminal domain
MGNAPITVGLRTEKLCYRAGDRVNGTVYVSVNQPQGQPIRAILLRLEGQERAVVHYTSTETEGDASRSRDHYDESNVTFSKMEHPLQTFPTGKIGRGHYEFPFTIQLPQSLPSSMDCQSGQSHCSVQYKLTATFAKPSSGLFSSHPFSKRN